MMLDFYQYRDEVKRAILHWKANLSSNWDPFVAAWLAYALSQDGIENNPPLSELAGDLYRWSQEPQVWEFQRHLGPLSLMIYLHRKDNKMHRKTIREIIERISQEIERANMEDKFSPFRDPEQLFLIALGITSVEEEGGETKRRLVAIAKDQMNGSLKRRLLYAAALKELGEKVDIALNATKVFDPGDIIGLIWWSERNGDKSPNSSQHWQTFISVKDSLVLIRVNKEAIPENRILSVPELSMLYEALARVTEKPNPNMLFDIYPLHQRIREIAEKHFKSGAYVAAVDQATKVLNEFIQQKTGITNKSEAELVQATMKQMSDPQGLKIKFNKFLDEGSGKNEQVGLALIAEGVFKAFRNPKGHKPENHPLVQIDGYEALAQLIIIDYIMKRVEEAGV